MRKTMASAALSLALMSSAAMADERVGDAALGALSGALVLGPIGAAAGALADYTAGPSIARSWGVEPASTTRQVRRPAMAEPSANVSSPAEARNRADAYVPTTAQPSAPKSASDAPPVQSLE